MALKIVYYPCFYCVFCNSAKVRKKIACTDDESLQNCGTDVKSS